MNILYLTNHLNIGGITSYVLTLAKGMKKMGHQVYLASSGGKLLPRFIQEGVIYVQVPISTKSELNPKIIVSMFKLLALIKEENIEIIHSNSRTTQVLGYLLERNSSAAHLFTCHGFFKTRFFRKLFPCWSKIVIAVSKEVREHLIRDFTVEDNKIAMIPNGVDCERLSAVNVDSITGLRRRLGLGSGPVIGIVARLSDVKGHSYLIQALPAVLGKIPNAQLLIVGEGRMKKKLLDFTKNLKLDKNIFFVPSLDETAEVLSLIDVFVLPSLAEGLGLSLMEAMAAGRAVVGSDIGGIRSLIKDRDTGLLVRPADKESIACAIIELLNNPQLRQRLGSQARIFIKNNFSKNNMLSATERIYYASVNN